MARDVFASGSLDALSAQIEAVQGGLGAPNVIESETPYTLVLNDAGKTVEVDSEGPQNIIIPDDDTVNFPIGTVIEVCQVNVGQIVVIGAGDVVIRSPDELITINKQWGTVSLRKRAADEWVLAGWLS